MIVFVKIILLFSSLINILLGLFVFKNSRRDKTKLYFAIFAITTGFWVLSNFLLRYNTNYYLLRTTFAIASLLPLLVAVWLLHFRGKIRVIERAIIFTLTIFSSFFFIAPFIKDLVVIGELASTDPFTPFNSGSLFSFYAAYNSLAIIIPLVISAMIWRQSTGAKKLQIKFIFFGLMLFSIGPLFLSLILPLFGIEKYASLDSPFSLFFVAFSTYSIIRHRLMDVRIVIKKTLVYVVAMSLILGFGLLIFLLMNWYLIEGTFNYTRVVSGFILFAILLPVFSYLLHKLERFTDKHLFKEIYNTQEAINSLGKQAAEIIELDELVSAITDTIMKSMGLNRAGVLLKDEDDEEGRKYNVVKVVGFDESNGISHVQDNILIKYLKLNRQPIVFEELEMKIRDCGDDKECLRMQGIQKNMKEIEAGLCLPLIYKKDLQGIIVLGNKISGDAYTSQDIDLLKTLATQSSVAIENAQMYKTMKDFNSELKKRVDKATKELKDKNKDLEELLKMKSEFLTVASHQLRTPTSIVRGMLSMLHEEGDALDPEQKKEFIEQAYMSVNHLERIVHDLLSATELEGGSMSFNSEPVDLYPIVKRVMTERKPLAKKKDLKFTIKKLKNKLPLTLIDATKIEEVIGNVIDNAINYTPAGSVEVMVDGDNKYNKIIVKDSGIGISNSEKEKIFERFKRGDGISTVHPNGSGLGLYIAKGVVDSLFGKIELESEGQGKGSVFTIYLPIVKQ